MPQNRFISPTTLVMKSVSIAGRRLERTLAPPTSAVEFRDFDPTENVEEPFKCVLNVSKR
jgi:hypothetical protein